MIANEINNVVLPPKIGEKLLIENFSQFLKFYIEKNPDFIIPDNFKEDFKTFVKTVSKHEPVDNRCVGLKKDGERCNGKKKAGYDLCSIHLRPKPMGNRMEKIKNQRLKPVVELEPEIEDNNASSNSTEKELVSSGCQYVFSRGKNKGETCGKQSQGSFCKSHSKTKTPLSPAIITPEMEVELDVEYENQYIPDNASTVSSVKSNVSGKRIHVYETDDLFGSEPEEDSVRNYEGYEY